MNPSANRESVVGESVVDGNGPGVIPAWVTKKVPVGTRCPFCHSDDIASFASFSVGSGIAFRPIADDVYCRRCSAIGQPK